MAKNRLSIPVAAVVRERNAVISKPERTLRIDARAARAWRARCAAALLTCWAASGAHAGSFSGSVSGSWSTPVLSGNLVDGATGALTPTDNTTTAQCNLGGCGSPLLPIPPGDPATTLVWGTGASPPPSTSTLSFTASPPFTQQPSNTDFELGTFDYLNGASDTGSLIFGATLTLKLTDQSSNVIDTQIVPLVITTTSNDGTSAQNADFVQFPATFTTLNAAPSMNVFEGKTATFMLEGEIVGDPTLRLTQLLIAPGSEFVWLRWKRSTRARTGNVRASRCRVCRRRAPAARQALFMQRGSDGDRAFRRRRFRGLGVCR